MPEPAPRFTRLDDWLTWQNVGQITPGLDRCRAVAGVMGLTALPGPVITVAGTNGKGSTVAFLEAILLAGGHRVGCYTSPHLIDYNERIRVDGAMVPDAAICAAFARIDAARGATPLSYFEFGTLAAFDIFARQRPDACILEVGLGGRLDAVNLIDADVALVTAIGIDHTEWLGDTRAAIAREKAGIFRPGRPALCSDPDAPASLHEVAAEVGCTLEVLGVDYHFEIEGHGWNWWSRMHRLADLPAPALAGAHQYRNAAGALAALAKLGDRLPITIDAVRTGLATVKIAGRYEMHAGEVEWIFDVAHNVQSAQALAANLARQHADGRTLIVAGMLADKDIGGVMAVLDPAADEWHLATTPPPRGAGAGMLAAARRQLGRMRAVHEHDSVQQACAAALASARRGDRIVVTGSFVTVGAASQWFATISGGAGGTTT